MDKDSNQSYIAQLRRMAIFLLIVLIVFMFYIFAYKNNEQHYLVLTKNIFNKSWLDRFEATFKSKIFLTKTEDPAVVARQQADLIESFKKNHKKIVTNLKPKKFCYVVRNGAGYGNKMNGLFTGFTMALATNSALIVNWHQIDNYIEEPMNTTFVPNDENQNIQNELRYNYRSDETRRLPGGTANSFNANKQLESCWKYVPDNKTDRLVFITVGPVFYDLGCDVSFYSVFRAYGLVSEETLQKATAILNATKIVTNNETLNIVYRVGFELAHNILKLFWKPKPIVANQISQIYEKHFKNNFVIGIQLRYRYLEWNDTFMFFKCAQKIELTVKNKPIKWFISSDRGDFVEQIQKLYPDKVIVANGRITHVEEDPSGWARALVDVEMLARADETIITSGSTFGYPLYIKSNRADCIRFSFGVPSTAPNGGSIVK